MIRDLKWMIFGGIKWRFRGFLIGVAVGVVLSSFGGDFLRSLVPEAKAAEFADQSYMEGGGETGSDWTRQDLPVVAYSTDMYARYVLMTAQNDGYLSSATFRMAREQAGCDTEQFAVGAFAFIGYDEIGEQLGASSWIDCSDLNIFSTEGNADENFEIGALSEQALYFEEGEQYWLGLNFEQGTISTGPNLNVELSNDFGSVWHVWCADDDCSGDFEIDNSSYPIQVVSYFDTDPTYQEALWTIELGPYFKSEWSAPPSGYYQLDYSCADDGDIYIMSSTFSDTAFYDSSFDCVDGEEGQIVLELGTDESTEWDLALYKSGTRYTQYSIEIFHDDIWTTYTTAGGSVDDENVISSAFSYIWGALIDVPVVGDALALNNLIWRDFIANLGNSDVAVIDIDSDFLGENYDVTIDFYDIVDDVQAELDDNANYESFRILMTTLFWALVIFGFVRSFTHKSEEDGV